MNLEKSIMRARIQPLLLSAQRCGPFCEDGLVRSFVSPIRMGVGPVGQMGTVGRLLDFVNPRYERRVEGQG